MRRDAWLSLLDRLATLTEAGRAAWEVADLPGAHVLSQPSGSVVVRVSRALLGQRTFTVEIRDPDGQVRAEESASEAAPPTGFSSTEAAELRQRIERLVAAIEEGDKAAEDLANAILDDAEHASQ